MPKITAFEDLECWKESRALVKEIYSITNRLPFSKDFGLKDQIQRASVSVMTNISEVFQDITEKNRFGFLIFRKVRRLRLKACCM